MPVRCCRSACLVGASSCLHEFGDLLDALGLLLADGRERIQQAVAVDAEPHVGALDGVDEVVVELVGRLLVAELVVEHAVEVLVGLVLCLHERLDLLEGDRLGVEFVDESLQSVAMAGRLLCGLLQHRPDLVVQVGRRLVRVFRRSRLDDFLEDDPGLEETSELVVRPDGNGETHGPTPPGATVLALLMAGYPGGGTVSPSYRPRQEIDLLLVAQQNLCSDSQVVVPDTRPRRRRGE